MIKNPLINVLTRTSSRPKGFEICVNSVRNQTYTNINHIISYDDDKDLEYIKNFNVKKIKINKDNIIKNYTGEKFNNPNFWFSPHNLYCNVLLNEVSDGWIMFLDDDDMLTDKYVIEKIVNNISNNDTMIIWQMKYPNGKVLPDENSFSSKKISLGGIGSPCYTFHSKWKNNYEWDAYKCGDFRYLEKIYNTIPNKKWIKEPLITLNNFGGHGLKKDVLNMG